LITESPECHLSAGFTGDDSYLLLTLRDGIILSDPRYTTQLEAECPDLELVIRRPGKANFGIRGQNTESPQGLPSWRSKKFAWSAESFQRLGRPCPRSAVLTSGLVEQLRRDQDKEEVARPPSRALCQRAFAVVKASLRVWRPRKTSPTSFEHQIRLFGGQ